MARRRPATRPLSLPVETHPSALLRLPLVRTALGDPTVRYVRRAIDARWNYNEEIAPTLTGFNPTTGCVFYRAHSHVDRWLADPGGDPRAHNPSDRLMSEAMFLVHDWLHILGYQWIAGLMPELGFGTSPVSPQNFEAFVFCHLLTEAVATVGLDYWFLGRLDLNRELSLGTGFTDLTVSYRAEHEDEYRRFCPGFTAQRPAFFADLVRFYCTGGFEGFGKDDLARSPLLIRWLEHELRYGEKQRQYTREWLAFLADTAIPAPKGGIGAPVRAQEAWQRRLARDVGERLWAVARGGEEPTDRAPIDPARGWRSPGRKPYDFRFLNWNRVVDGRRWAREPLKASTDEEFRHWYRQFLVRLPYDRVAPELLAIRDDLLVKRRVDLCTYFYREIEPLAAAREEPVDLFLLG